MHRKLNDRDKHTSVYPERAQYLGGTYRLNLLLKFKTLSHETHSFSNSFQTDTGRLQKIFIHTLLLNIVFSNLKINKFRNYYKYTTFNVYFTHYY